MGEERAKITKVVFVDKEFSPVAAGSAQVPEDPFSYGQNGLQEPPYNPDALLTIAERHPVHAAALEQKSADIAGTGWTWEKIEDGADEEQRKELDEWLRGLADPERDETTPDIIHSAWLDLETIGHGAIEIARDSTGKVKKIYSVSAASTRFHRLGLSLAQGKVGKRVWFKRWVPSDNRKIDKKTGKVLDGAAVGDRETANELLILRKPARRSSWYGIPNYVSAIGWLALSLAARDDNIQFFENRREPRWAIILENIEETDDLESVLQQAFTSNLKQPHKNIIIPIEGDGKIHFQQLSQDSKDVSFDRLQERAAGEILLAHRLPPDRLGLIRVGPLGGNATMAASRVYKEAVVLPGQELLQDRMNRFIQNEGPIAKDELKWRWKPVELDITEQTEDAQVVTQLFTSNIIRLNEARKRIGLTPLEADDKGENPGEKFFFELAPEAAQASAAASAAASVGAQFGQQRAADILLQRSAGGSPLSEQEEQLRRRVLEILGPEVGA